MTIIRPKKEGLTTRHLIIALGALAVLNVVAVIYLYNRVVNDRHEAMAYKDELRTIEVKNAELKTAVYALVEPQRMQQFAQARGLVMERNPHYVGGMQLSNNQ